MFYCLELPIGPCFWRVSGPQGPDWTMRLERWEEVLQDFCDAPENDAVKARLNECVRELIEIV